jgi:hypothetical protein
MRRGAGSPGAIPMLPAPPPYCPTNDLPGGIVAKRRNPSERAEVTQQISNGASESGTRFEGVPSRAARRGSNSPNTRSAR